jgi:hypothetical protein
VWSTSEFSTSELSDRDRLVVIVVSGLPVFAVIDRNLSSEGECDMNLETLPKAELSNDSPSTGTASQLLT